MSSPARLLALIVGPVVAVVLAGGAWVRVQPGPASGPGTEAYRAWYEVRSEAALYGYRHPDAPGGLEALIREQASKRTP